MSRSPGNHNSKPRPKWATLPPCKRRYPVIAGVRGVAAGFTTIDRHAHDVDVGECSLDGVFRCLLGCAVDDGHMVAVVFQHPGEIEESEGWNESADGDLDSFGDSELGVRRVDKKDIHGVVTPFQLFRARTRDSGSSVIDPLSVLKQCPSSL